MNAALLMVVFCATMLVAVSANRAEIHAKRYADEGGMMAESDILSRQRRRSISLACTAMCSDYWSCRAKTFFFNNCHYPSGCKCACFIWKDCE
uniref:Uncharacterized protein n=1 Tax=Plectus sambesii TaxID=2011161 RepID=A0A914WHT7_9BILA